MAPVLQVIAAPFVLARKAIMWLATWALVVVDKTNERLPSATVRLALSALPDLRLTADDEPDEVLRWVDHGPALQALPRFVD